jgi:cytoskeletal protein RodZ
MDIGTRLRHERESQNLTLRQIGDVTKLSMTTLRRIERNEFDALPGGILIKGYLRAYAAAVGLVPDEIVRQYLARDAAERATVSLPVAPPIESRHARSKILVLAVVVAAAVVAYSWQTRSGERIEGSVGATNAEPGGASPLAGATSSNAMPTSAQEFRLTLDIQSAGVCWVSISADGKRTLHRLFLPGDRASVTAEDELVVRVGEPGAFIYTLNGVRGRQLGEPGQPVTVTITRENYEGFLEPVVEDPRESVLT